MNLANTITLSRIFLTFVFLFFLSLSGWIWRVLALAVFLLAALTDFFDGRVARLRGELSDLGRLMDPIADKILILSAFFAFLEMGLIDVWMVVAIVAREFLITGMRLLAASRGVVLSADRGGKHKMVSQVTAIIVILLILAARSLNEHFAWGMTQEVDGLLKGVVTGIMLAVVAVTLTSGVRYLQLNQRRISGSAGGGPR